MPGVDTHNGDTVVVDVCSLVKLLLNLGVLTLGSGELVSFLLVQERAIGKLPSSSNLLNTTRVEGGLVDAVGNHFQ